MSLKHPRFLNAVKCRGREAVESSLREISQWGKMRRFGTCGECGRTFEVSKSGTVRPHLNYEGGRG